MPTTANRNYPYPATTDPALVPDDLRRALEMVDADVQTLDDGKAATDHLHDDRYYIKRIHETTLMDDDFDRTGALIGSTPDVGQAWQGGNPSNAGWSTSAGSATANQLSAVVAPLGVIPNQVTIDLTIAPGAPSTPRALSIALGGGADLWAVVTINTAGQTSIAVQKRFTAGATTTLVPGFFVISQAPTVPTPVQVSLAVLGGAVTITAGGQSYSATITAAEIEQIAKAVTLTASTDISSSITVTRARASSVEQPDVFPPSPHRHVITDVDGLRDELDETVEIDDVPGLRAALDIAGDGYSAYELAVQQGYVGTLEQWLASLHGQDGSNVLPDREAVTGALGIFSANAYGADPGATTEVNRAGFQAANDAAALAGGGRVVAAPGTYTVAGIMQDSHVELYLPAVTLRHPTGSGVDIIRSRTHSTTGSIAAGSSILTVASAAGIEVGTVIGVRAADGYSTIQWTTLTAGIAADQVDGITIDRATGFQSSGILVVGSEVVQHTGMTGTTLTGVTRGLYGTTPAAHTAGARIGTAMRLVAEVTAVSGTTITLDRPSDLTLTDTPVSAGIIHPKITGVRLNGARVKGTPATSTNPLRWDLTRWGIIRDIRVDHAESALFLAQGSRDCLIDGLTADECSVPELSMGSVVWLFQQCHRNTLSNLMVTGDVWVGVYLDNRTSLATEWDGSCDGNTGSHWRIHATPHTPFITNAALDIIGSNQNTFSHITTSNIRTGMLIASSDQVYTGDDSIPTGWGNHIDGMKMINGSQPYVIHSPGNSVTGLTYEGNLFGTAVDGNLVAMSGMGPGAAPTLGRFGDGTQYEPGIAFANERNTGFYKIAPGQIQVACQAQLIARFRTSGILMGDGKHLTLGTGTGTQIGTSPTEKLAFWGATPVTRPTARADTSGATLAALEAEVNALKGLLRQVGLMAG